MTIKAIETHYAGCRFRSRLEARWAVFFDELGIEWEYEPQGYVISEGYGNPDDKTFPYLPDFYLRDYGAWAEVKGHWTAIDLEGVMWATSPHGGLPASPEGDRGDRQNRVLLLSSLGGGGASSFCISFWKGDVFLSTWSFDQQTTHDAHFPEPVWMDCGTWHIPPDHLAGHLNSALVRVNERGLTAARSARFEHGETPVPRGHRW